LKIEKGVGNSAIRKHTSVNGSVTCYTGSQSYLPPNTDECAPT